MTSGERCPFCDAAIIEGRDTHAIGCPNEDPWDDEPDWFSPEEFSSPDLEEEEDEDEGRNEDRDEEDTDRDLKSPFG